VSNPIWGSWPDIYNCLTITVLFLWGALSDERTGLSFVYAAGPCQRNLSRVRVSWDSRPYFTVSDLRLPVSSPPTTRRTTVEVFDPASTRGLSHCLLAPMVSKITPLHGPHRKQSLHCWVIRGNVFIEPLPRNRFRNTAVLLLRDLATDCLPSMSFLSNEL
jgi:hypothetical protein